MREVRIGKLKLTLQDDIEQMSIAQFNKVNKYWMLSDSLGNDFADIDKMHLSRLLLVAGDKDKTIKEVNNLRILVNNIIQEVSPEQLAFVALIHSIDGQELTDYSEDNLKRLAAELPLKVGDIRKKNIREKIYSDLEIYFPDIFKNILSVSFWQRMKQKTLKELDAILDPSIDIRPEIESTNRYFASLINPHSFTGLDNYELQYDKDFEQNCIVLSEYTRQPVKTLTVKEYFTLVQYFNKLQKQKRVK